MGRPLDIFTYRNIIWDMDGTVLNSIPAWGRAFGIAAAALHGLDARHCEEVFRKYRCQPLERIMQLCLQPSGIEVTEEVFDALERRMCAEHEEIDVEFFPGALMTLQETQKAGLCNFLSSKSRCSTVAERTKDPEVKQLFKLVLGNTKLKKGPQHIERFARHMKQSLTAFLEGALLVGDSRSDMQMARDAGIPAVGISGTVSADSLYEAGAQVVYPSVAHLLVQRG